MPPILIPEETIIEWYKIFHPLRHFDEKELGFFPLSVCTMRGTSYKPLKDLTEPTPYLAVDIVPSDPTYAEIKRKYWNKVSLGDRSVRVLNLVKVSPDHGIRYSYAWLHDGPWITDFPKLIPKAQALLAAKELEDAERAQRRQKYDDLIEKEVLASYISP